MSSIFDKVKEEAKKEQLIQRNIYIPKDLWEELQVHCLQKRLNKESTSASKIIVNLVERYLKRVNKK